MAHRGRQAGGGAGGTLILVHTGGRAVQRVVVGGVAIPAGAVLPARHVHADAVRAAGFGGTLVIRCRRRTLVHVLLTLWPGEAGRTGAGPGAAAHPPVITGCGAHR